MAHGAWFGELDGLLSAAIDLWQIRPFHHRSLVWEESNPALCTALLALDDASVTALETDERTLASWLAPWLGMDGARLLSLGELSPLPVRPLSVPARFETGIAGRKWQQIQALAAVLPAEQRPVLEWCAGKGHLGRLLARVDGREITSLEWQGALCEAGQSAAQEAALPIRFVHADAFAPDSARWLPAQGQAVALHACGDLHTTLMHQWAASDCRRLTFSPCCYHLIRGDSYQPLSRQGAASPLHLARLDLQLPLAQTVTGGQSAVRKRHREVLWRLAFDEWQRDVRGGDEYLPLPPFPKSLLAGDFVAFATWAAAIKQLPIPSLLDEPHWLRRGAQRQRLVRRMELVSHFFRRPLEIWLALDRVLYLEEQGAAVRLGTFCDHTVTPRNIVIDAERG